MKIFICRIMIFVFFFNLLSASNAWAKNTPLAISTSQLEEEIDKSKKESLEQEIFTEMLYFDMAETPYELAAANERLHALMEQYSELQKEEEKKEAEKKEQEKKQQLKKNPFDPALQDSGRMGVHYATNSTIPQTNASPRDALKKTNEVLIGWENDTLGLADLISYIDPFDPDDFNMENLIFASQLLGNSMHAYANSNLSEEVVETLFPIVMQAQIRSLYRLNKLLKNRILMGKGADNTSTQYIEAVSSLMISLLRTHNFYVKAGIPDPVANFLLGKNTFSLPEDDFAVHQKEDQTVETAFEDVSFNSRTFPQKNLIVNEVFDPVVKDIYAQMMHTFLWEIQTLAKESPNSESAKFYDLKLWSEYAATFAVLYQPAYLEQIINLLDHSPKKIFSKSIKDDIFEHKNTSILSAVFTNIYETVKYTADASVWHPVLQLLKKFSDRNEYSLATVTDALKVASLMYNQRNESCNMSNAYMQGGVFMQCNSGDPDENELRPLFAARVVDLYYPLVEEHRYITQDYGISSEEMQVFANELAHIYNAFANDELKWNRAANKRTNFWTADNGESMILNEKDSIPLIHSPVNPYLITRQDGTEITVGGFGRDSNGRWHIMGLKNGVNVLKREKEATKLFFDITANAILWVYGGEIFSLIGAAYRTTKGAVVALPKAIKSASLAKKGRRMLAFSVEIKKSTRYHDLLAKLRTNGYTLAYHSKTGMEEVPLTKRNLLLTTGKTPKKIPSTVYRTGVSESKVIQKRADLQNRNTSLRLNPRKEQEPIDQITLIHQRTGFETQAVTVDLSDPKAPLGLQKLREGIKNYDDFRVFQRQAYKQLKDPKGNNELLVQELFGEPIPSWKASFLSWFSKHPLGKITEESTIIKGVSRALNIDKKSGSLDGIFNYWKYTKEGQWVRISGKEFAELSKDATSNLKELKDWYKILGVTEEATAKEIRSAYAKLSREFHPDQVEAAFIKFDMPLLQEKGYPEAYIKALKKQILDAANAKAAELNEAYTILSSTPKRIRYEQDLLLKKKPLPTFSDGNSLGIGINRNMKNNQFRTLRTTDLPTIEYTLSKYIIEQFGNTGANPLQFLLAGNTRFFEQFRNNLLFFSAWAGLDKVAFEASKTQILPLATKERDQELNKYGSLFTTSLNLPPQNNITKITEGTSSPEDLYSAITANKETPWEGSFLTTPVLYIKYGMLRQPLLADQEKKNLDHFSRILALLKANDLKIKRIHQKDLETRKELIKEYEILIEKAKQTQSNYFKSIGNSKAVSEVAVIFDACMKEIKRILNDTSEDLSVQIEQIESLISDLMIKLKNLQGNTQETYDTSF